MSPDKSKEETTLEIENGNATTVEIEPKEQNVIPQTGNHHNESQQTLLSCGDEKDVIVNITGNGCAISGGKGVESNACVDLIDMESTYSSSFGDTGSGLDTGSGSDSDVESPMCSDWREPTRLRTKRLTDHWRRFIDPLVWRSKWIELQLKKLNSLALKYEKELAAYDDKKHRELLKFAVDGFDVKSVPKSDGIQSHKVMRRNKRRRAEECNLSSYMSSHSIFSYYENKNHSPDACLESFCGDVMSNADNDEEFKLSDMRSTVDHEDNDKSFFDAIQKVERLLLHVKNLRARLDNVINENPGKFCSVTQSSTIGPSDGFNHAGQCSASLSGNEKPYPVSFVNASSTDKSELYVEDPPSTENTLSAHNGITPFIKTATRPQVEAPQENTKGKVLIHNQTPKKELHGFENVRNQLVEKPKESDEKPKSISPSSKSSLVTDNAAPRSHSTLEACSRAKSNFSRKVGRGRNS